MNKLIFSIVIILVMLICGCTSSKDTLEISNTTKVINTTEETNTLITTQQLNKSEYEYEIANNSFSDNRVNVVLKYPTVSGIDNADDINKMISDYCIYRYSVIGITAEKSVATYYEVTDVKVMLSYEKFISAIVVGKIYSDDGMQDEAFSYSLNIDLVNVKMLESSDMIKDYEGIRKLFTDGLFTQSYGMDNVCNEMSYEDMVTSYREDYGILPYIWFDGENFGINIDLPYTLGGYAGFKYSIGYFTEYLNTEIEIIAELCGKQMDGN